MDYVFSAVDLMIAWGDHGGGVYLQPNQIWFADDPLVLARPELFSSTPLVVHSTAGREGPGASAVLVEHSTAARGSVVNVPVKATRGRYRG